MAGVPADRPDLSLVVLCYASGLAARDFARRTLRVLDDSNIGSFELILVANFVPGSGDRTPEILEDLAAEEPRIRPVSQPKQGWLGWDMRSGLSVARGRLIGVIDGDGQMLASDVPRLYELLADGNYDLVKTYRTTRDDGIRRRLLSASFNGLFQLLFPGVRCRDINSKPKIMLRTAYERMELRSEDWFIDAEIMLQARRLGLRVGELPTRFRGLSGRRSFVSLTTVFEFLGNMARYRWREWLR